MTGYTTSNFDQITKNGQLVYVQFEYRDQVGKNIVRVTADGVKVEVAGEWFEYESAVLEGVGINTIIKMARADKEGNDTARTNGAMR